jgi:hypothetical protein
MYRKGSQGLNHTILHMEREREEGSEAKRERERRERERGIHTYTPKQWGKLTNN